jgi:hypothetical protein
VASTFSTIARFAHRSGSRPNRTPIIHFHQRHDFATNAV